MPRKPQSRIRTPTAEELAAADAQYEREYLAWALRAINAQRLNLTCPSTRCWRNGCQNLKRCEPRHHASLERLTLELLTAQLEENSVCEQTRNGPGAGKRRKLLAKAKASGLLPLYGFGTDDLDAEAQQAGIADR